MPRRLLVLFLMVAGCGGADGVASPEREAPLADVWAGLAVSERDYEGCSVAFATQYGFGVRELACRTASGVPLAAVVARAPAAPFVRGPHTATAERVELDLRSDRAFGHYDPAFVDWVTAVAVPQSATVRRLAQPVYDRRVARSARIFWLAYEGLRRVGYPGEVTSPRLRDYAAFLEGGPVTEAIQGFQGGESISTYTFYGDVVPLLPEGEALVRVDGEALAFDRWELREEASTALAFWLRRRADGTQARWHAGLRDLLTAFDAGWLAAHGG